MLPASQDDECLVSKLVRSGGKGDGIAHCLDFASVKVCQS